MIEILKRKGNFPIESPAKKQNNQLSAFTKGRDKMPADLLDFIVKDLEIDELKALSITSKKWLKITGKAAIWRHLCQEAGLHASQSREIFMQAVSCQLPNNNLQSKLQLCAVRWFSASKDISDRNIQSALCKCQKALANPSMTAEEHKEIHEIIKYLSALHSCYGFGSLYNSKDMLIHLKTFELAASPTMRVHSKICQAYLRALYGINHLTDRQAEDLLLECTTDQKAPLWVKSLAEVSLAYFQVKTGHYDDAVELLQKARKNPFANAYTRAFAAYSLAMMKLSKQVEAITAKQAFDLLHDARDSVLADTLRFRANSKIATMYIDNSQLLINLDACIEVLQEQIADPFVKKESRIEAQLTLARLGCGGALKDPQIVALLQSVCQHSCVEFEKVLAEFILAKMRFFNRTEQLTDEQMLATFQKFSQPVSFHVKLWQELFMHLKYDMWARSYAVGPEVEALVKNLRQNPQSSRTWQESLAILLAVPYGHFHFYSKDEEFLLWQEIGQAAPAPIRSIVAKFEKEIVSSLNKD